MKKILIFRLSSMGDVILSTSGLSALPADTEVHWVVAEEWAPLLEGHPKISKVWTFNRKKGLREWLRLCGKLAAMEFPEVIDLHRNLRTGLARMVFYLFSRSQWRSISKTRWRLWGYFTFKKYWPVKWRPRPWVNVFAHALGGLGIERPDFRHLLGKKSNPASRTSYWCVMPSSKWSGKQWPVAQWAELIRMREIYPVVLGTLNDRTSLALCHQLSELKLPYESRVGKTDFEETAELISHAVGYLGTDTGLAHLAEAVGTPSFVVFGPTMPDQGFGPWKRESQALGRNLNCRPCGKDGRICFRLFEPRACLKGFSPEDASHQMKTSVLESR